MNQSEVMKKVREVLESAADHYAGLRQYGMKDEVDETLRLLDSAAPEGGQEPYAYELTWHDGTTTLDRLDMSQLTHGVVSAKPLYDRPAGLIPVSKVEALAKAWDAVDEDRDARAIPRLRTRTLRALINKHQSAQPSVSPSPQSATAFTEFSQRAAQDILMLIGMQTAITTRSVASRKHIDWLVNLLSAYQNATPSAQQDTKP